MCRGSGASTFKSGHYRKSNALDFPFRGFRTRTSRREVRDAGGTRPYRGIARKRALAGRDGFHSVPDFSLWRMNVTRQGTESPTRLTFLSVAFKRERLEEKS